MNDADVLVSRARARVVRARGASAKDGVEALRSATKTTRNATVVVINMPALDGVSFVTALTAVEKDCPVWVPSAHSPVDERDAGLESGLNKYLFKSFGSGERVVLARALLRRQAPVATFSTETNTVGPLDVDFRVPGAHVNAAGLPLRAQ